MLIEGGRIRAVGRRADLPIPAEAEILDAGGRVVMPGFVDAHTHPVFAGDRADEFELRISGVSYKEIAERGGGIRSTVRRTRLATEQELLATASRNVRWFLACGTTAIEAKSGYGLSVEDELKLLRVISRLKPIRCVPTFLGAHETPDEYRGRKRDYVDLVVRRMLPAVASERLAEYCDVFCERGVFDLDDARRIFHAARSAGLGVRMHADQFTDFGGALLAAELKATAADHLEHVSDEGIAAMARAGVQPVLLPGAVYAMGSTRYPRARDMIDAGCAVVLATDFNPGTSPTPSMPMILSLAMTQMRMTAAEAISAATINAAYSVSRGGAVGSLEPGKLADFAIFDCRDYREIPYWFGLQHATATYIGGRLEHGRRGSE
jgi:imidazolonepropionase